MSDEAAEKPMDPKLKQTLTELWAAVEEVESASTRIAKVIPLLPRNDYSELAKALAPCDEVIKTLGYFLFRPNPGDVITVRERLDGRLEQVSCKRGTYTP